MINQTAKTSIETHAQSDNDAAQEDNTDLIPVDMSAPKNFYDFYLAEHQNIACRRLHFAGSSFGLLGLANSIKKRSFRPVLKGIAAGYACAWVGHFFFEKNKPASFKFPLKSFASDFRMYGDVLRGKLSLTDTSFDKIKMK